MESPQRVAEVGEAAGAKRGMDVAALVSDGSVARKSPPGDKQQIRDPQQQHEDRRKRNQFPGG